jgi:hypothetical protein
MYIWAFDAATPLSPALLFEAGQHPLLLKGYVSLCVLVGAVMCFYGCRAFRFVLGAFGALAGAYASAVAVFELTGGSGLLTVLAVLAGAALGSVLMVTLYLLGVFVIGAVLAGSAGAMLTWPTDQGTRSVVVIALLAAIGGFLALFFQRFIITVATAFNGAGLVVGGLWLLICRMAPTEAVRPYGAAAPTGSLMVQWVLFGGWLALGFVGAWVQYAQGPPPPKAAKPAPTEKPEPTDPALRAE